MESYQINPAQIRCLWLARELPFPSNTGDRIYSGRMAEALAASGMRVTYVGLEAVRSSDVPANGETNWLPIQGKRRSNWIALFSRFPLVTAAHATRSMREALSGLLSQPWEAIVLDHYGTAWALDAVKEASAQNSAASVLIHVTHNHEEALARDLYRSHSIPSLKRIVLYLNYLKIRHWERRLIREVHIVSTITDEDAKAFSEQSSSPEFLVLTPGHSGATVSARTITKDVPRRVILVGSFRWLVKQQNLCQLLVAADSRFADNKISLDVIGDVPSSVLREFGGKLRATVFHGFVANFMPLFESARMAIVPEVIGGGFKLKFLDYIFGRMPIATLSNASSGFPATMRCNFLQSASLEGLVDLVIRHIDDVPRLNSMQTSAFDEASLHFDWADRGAKLRRAILQNRSGAT